MEIFNIGPLELGLILILALIILGPDGMVKSVRQIGRWIAKIIRSPIWKEMMSTSEEIRSIPQKIVKEANLEETMQEVSRLSRIPANYGTPQPEEISNLIKPPEESKQDQNQTSDE
jgi:Sec-independent protein translocase protein TatA